MLPWGKRAQAVKRAEELLEACCRRLELAPKVLDKGARDWIGRRNWPADSAEMDRVVTYAALTAPGETIEAAHFAPRRRCDHEAFGPAQFDAMALEEIVRQKVGHFFGRLGPHEVRGVYRTVIDQVERALIEEALRWAEGNQLKAARVLGISRNTLRKKMHDLKCGP